jgi:hypothetical protein
VVLEDPDSPQAAVLSTAARTAMGRTVEERGRARIFSAFCVPWCPRLGGHACLAGGLPQQTLNIADDPPASPLAGQSRTVTPAVSVRLRRARPTAHRLGPGVTARETTASSSSVATASAATTIAPASTAP